MQSPKEFKRSLKSKDKSRDIEPSTGDQVLFEVYTRLYDQISHIVDDGSIDFSNLDLLVKSAMEAVDFVSSQKQPPIDGTAKCEIAKKLIVKVIQDLTTKGKIPKNIGDDIVIGVNLMGPVIFKLVIMASKGQFNLISMFGADGSCCKPGGCRIL